MCTIRRYVYRLLFPKHFSEKTSLVQYSLTLKHTVHVLLHIVSFISITTKDEDDLAELLIQLCRLGFQLTRQYAFENNIKGFSSQTCSTGHKWLKGFLRRLVPQEVQEYICELCYLH